MGVSVPGLLLVLLPVAIAAAVLAFVGGRGVSVFKKQGVAWGLTALMIVAAIGIGNIKALAGSPASEPDLPQVGPGAFPSHVRDDAGVLSDGTERTLDERNLRLYGRYGVVIAVITCNYGGDDLYDYALKRGKEIGATDSDFIVALDISGDNYYLIGIEGYFTDEDCSEYAWNYMEDAFAAGDYDRAVLDLTEMLELWYDTNFG